MPPRFFRFGLVIWCAVLCAFAGAFQGLCAQSGLSPAAASNPGIFLIFPFENETKMANLDWLGEGLAELTAERLEDRGLSVLSRQERLTALEKMGLPDSARFSHATMLKIAAEADADEVIYGRYVSDGNMVTLEAYVLHLTPPRLSSPFTQTSTMQDLIRAQARLSSQLLCAIAKLNCAPDGGAQDETSFSEPPPSLRLDALQNFVQGLTGTDDEPRLRALREAARIEPAWDRPAYELGEIYFARRDCESALPWFSRVPPNRPDGPESSFDTGVCHLLRNDAERAEAAFSGLADRARSSDPKDRLPDLPEVHNNLGIAQLRLGKIGEAAAEFDRAAAVDSEEPDYWINLGIAKLAAKEPATAVTAFQHARDLAPDDNDARELLISTLQSVGRGSEAAAMSSNPLPAAGHAAQPIPKDQAGLVRLARISKDFDRSLLRSIGEDSDAPAAKASRKSGTSGDRP